MAFGSWFKNIVKGAKNVFNKVAPVLKRGAEIVSSVAPAIGSAIGGPVGNVINSIGNVAGKVNNITSSWKPSNSSPRMLGSNGAGRFNVPLLK